MNLGRLDLLEAEFREIPYLCADSLDDGPDGLDRIENARALDQQRHGASLRPAAPRLDDQCDTDDQRQRTELRRSRPLGADGNRRERESGGNQSNGPGAEAERSHESRRAHGEERNTDRRDSSPIHDPSGSYGSLIDFFSPAATPTTPSTRP